MQVFVGNIEPAHAVHGDIPRAGQLDTSRQRRADLPKLLPCRVENPDQFGVAVEDVDVSELIERESRLAEQDRLRARAARQVTDAVAERDKAIQAIVDTYEIRRTYERELIGQPG